MRPLLVDDACETMLRASMTRLGMIARVFHRTAKRPAISEAGLRSVKLARTIADLEGAVQIQTQHFAEAIQYRPRRQIQLPSFAADTEAVMGTQVPAVYASGVETRGNAAERGRAEAVGETTQCRPRRQL